MAKARPKVSLRKPPTAASVPANADAFVSGVKTSKRSDVQTSTPSGNRALIQRRDGRRLRRMTVYLPEDLARQIAVHCAAHDVDVSVFLAEAAEARLASV